MSFDTETMPRYNFPINTIFKAFLMSSHFVRQIVLLNIFITYRANISFFYVLLSYTIWDRNIWYRMTFY